MKKIIFKFWLTNVLVSVLLFFGYRIFIIETTSAGNNLFEKFAAILELLLNVWLSGAYLLLMLCCSLTFFLNLIDIVRNNFYLSLLTFLGIPLVGVLFLTVNILLDIYSYNGSVLTAFALFSTVYLFFTAGAFLMFRRRIRVAEELANTKNSF